MRKSIDETIEEANYYGSKRFDVPDLSERCRMCMYQNGGDGMTDEEQEDKCAQCPYFGFRAENETNEAFARINGWV